MSIRQQCYPTPDGSEPVFLMHDRHRRAVYNACLEQRSHYRKGGRLPGLSGLDQKQQLAELRAGDPDLRQGSSVVQQQAVLDLDRAFQNFFARPDHFRYPTYRSRKRHRGFYVRDLNVRRINRKWGEFLVPKAGWVRFRLTRPWAQIKAATSARVTVDSAGRWWVSFTAPPPVFPRVSTGRTVGIDRGARNSVATSGGELSTAPGWTAGEQTRFLALQRRLARQEKGSNRRERTRLQLAGLHARLADRRKDWVEQTTTRLVRNYDLISVEALNTTGMTRRPAPKPDPEHPGGHLPNGARAKAALNKAILASQWGRVERRLQDKTSTTPPGSSARLVKVPAAYSSQECSNCQHVASENRESQAVFRCVKCGHEQHADINAAVVIDGRGQALVLAENSELCGRTEPNVRRVRTAVVSRERTRKPPSHRRRVNQPAGAGA